MLYSWRIREVRCQAVRFMSLAAASMALTMFW
jgi:hypothetical protein